MEFQLTKYIETVTHHRVSLNNNDFGFLQKVKIVQMLGLFSFASVSRMYNFLVELNALRNNIAHHMNYDKKKLDEILLIVNKFHREKKEASVKSGIGMFDSIIRYFAGYLAASGVKGKLP